MFDTAEQKNLEQLTEKLFNIGPKEYPFFKKCLRLIAETEEGSRLLHSLERNFDGRKYTLRTQKGLENIGGINDITHEVVIGKPSLLSIHFLEQVMDREIIHGYPKALFHELTHWEQWQNKAGGGNAIAEPDTLFTTIMAEADAQASGDLFKTEQRETFDFGIFTFPFQIYKFIFAKLNPDKRFIARTKAELGKKHPDWSEEQIKKETKKLFFLKSVKDENADWRKVYENPKTIEQMAKSPEDAPYVKREFPEVMKYYMEKFNLTLDECQDLKRIVLEQSYENYLRQKEEQGAEAQVAENSKTSPSKTSDGPHLKKELIQAKEPQPQAKSTRTDAPKKAELSAPMRNFFSLFHRHKR